MFPKGWSRLQRGVVAGTLIYSVIFLGMLSFRPGSKEFYRAFNNIYQILPPLFAGLCGLSFARWGQGLPKNRRVGWLLIGTGGISFALGQMTWTYYETIRKFEVPFPSWADAGYLGAYPCLIVGLMLLFGSIPMAGRARLLLDSAITASGVGMLSWYFVVWKLWHKSDVTLLGKIISVSYPLADVVSLFGAMVLLNSITADKIRRRGLLFLASGLMLIAFFDTTFTCYTLSDTYETGSWFDWSLSFGWILIGYASLVQLLWKNPQEEIGKETVPTQTSAPLALLRVLIPYVAAILAFSVVAVYDYRDDHNIKTSVFTAGYGLIFLVILRQVFTMLENLHLTRQLRGFNEHLELTVERRTEQLNSMYELTAAVNNTLQVDQVLAAAAKHTLKALNADAVAIWLTERNTTTGAVMSRLYLHEGFADHAETFHFVNELPICEQRECVSLPDADTEADGGTFLRVPLRWQNVPMGMIGVIRWRESFGPTEPELLEGIGMEVGTALENARLYGAAIDAADRDPVTGLYNHRALHQRLDKLMEKAQKHAGSLSLLMMDMNNFKLFNDTYGHPAGDQVLKHVAQALRDECGDDDVAGRYGGDEFVLVLPHASSTQAQQVAERLHERLQREGFCRSGEERVIPISLCFGIATYPMDGVNRHELLTNADANLYSAKNSEEGIRLTSDTQRANRELRNEDSFGVLDAMITAVDNKDRYTRHHSEDVAEYALWIAEELRVSEETLRVIRIGGLLHDVGKIAVPDEILRKPGRLTDDEYAVLQRHPAMGALIVSAIPGMESILDAVRSHHERWDGQGYPDGTAGEETPFLGRIMAVADAFSAMTTDRPYRKGMDWEIALNEIRKNSGTQFDPIMADAFVRAALKRKPVQQNQKNTLPLAA
jgi:diguanylate cyclase (GGDEF)-like protein/putative nucleotidyltransferase with HDIG domain